MTISSSLNAGVAGLASNASRLATIADNIANSATFGYKRAETEFHSLVINSGSGTYSAGGVRITTTRFIDQAGALAPTNNPTDLAVRGRGFLPVTNETALISGTAQLGPMSRAMKAEEIDEFEKKHGYEPTQVRVAVDGLAVFVHKDNPIQQLTLQQVDGIFSKTRKGGGKDARTWGDLGLGGDWAARPISLYGRNSASGTYGFFKENALFKGDYRDTVKEQPGSASVVQGVTEDRYAMGYSGIGYRTSGVKAVRLAKKEGEFVGTDPESVLAGKYPLSRFLYVYVNKAPNQPLDPLVREFVKFLLSREGQEIVVKDGFLPASGKIVGEELAKLN